MKTLIWKEWREQRLFFFLAVGLIILSRAVPKLIPEEFLDYELYLPMALLLLPLLFSLFFGATSFTNEFTKNTKQFLLSQPVTTAKIFWTKYLFSLIILIILILISHVILSIPLLSHIILYTPFDYFMRMGIIRPVSAIYIFLAMLYSLSSFIIVYSAACFSSLLLKNGLPAILCAPFILLFGLLLVIPFVIFLFLISPNVYIFTCFLLPALIALFLTSGFLVWQKAIAKDSPSGKIVLMLSLAVLLISFGFHAIANLRATIRLNRTIYQATAQGVRMTPEEIIPPPVSDEENAALVYEKAFRLAERLKDKYKEEWKYMPYERGVKIEELTAEQKRTISGIMRDPEFVELYTLIEKAVNMPACRFDLNYGEGPAMLLPHLAKMRMLGRLQSARTYILGWESKHQEAWESAKLGLRLSNSLDNEPLLITKLVCIAVDMLAIDSFQQLLDKPVDIRSLSEYRELIKIIDQKNRRLMRQALEGELVLWGEYIF